MKVLAVFWLHAQFSGNEKENSSAFPHSMLSPWPIFVIQDLNSREKNCIAVKINWPFCY